jgi:hypothetical protein
MKLQLLAMFDSDQMAKGTSYRGVAPVGRLADKANPFAATVVSRIEGVLRSFGYKDLELLERLTTPQFLEIVKDIKWENVPGYGDVKSATNKINDEITRWFDVAKMAFQDLYERRMKLWSFIVSLVVVVALNANVFNLYHQFTSDSQLRDAAISWATARLAQPKDTTCVKAVLSQDQLVPAIKANVDSVRQILSADAFQVLGWKDHTFKWTSEPGWFWNWLGNAAGLLAMTFLVSLGAPFWYDFLKTIMGLKDSLKTKS